MESCPHCGRMLDDSWSVCAYCGGAIQGKAADSAYVANVQSAEQICPRCGKSLVPGAAFCGFCGYIVQGTTTSPPRYDRAPQGVLYGGVGNQPTQTRTSTGRSRNFKFAILAGFVVFSILAIIKSVDDASKYSGSFFHSLSGNFFMMMFLFLFYLWVLFAVWVYYDANSRGMSGGLWAFLVIICFFIGIIAYAILRESRPKVPSGYPQGYQYPIAYQAPVQTSFPAQANPTKQPAFCRGCGSPLLFGDTFCEQCGARV